jgi:hypothetical protein
MNKKIEEFIYGGNSKTAGLGRFTGKAIKYSALLFAALVLVAFGQFGQTMHSISDLRNNEISLWKIKNPDNEALANTFINECLNSKMKRSADIPISNEKKPVSLYECGNDLGANELVELIKKSDSRIVTAAWPLSLVS